jgi:hypothetical protein
MTSYTRTLLLTLISGLIGTVGLIMAIVWGGITLWLTTALMTAQVISGVLQLRNNRRNKSRRMPTM